MHFSAWCEPRLKDPSFSSNRNPFQEITDLEVEEANAALDTVYIYFVFHVYCYKAFFLFAS